MKLHHSTHPCSASLVQMESTQIGYSVLVAHVMNMFNMACEFQEETPGSVKEIIFVIYLKFLNELTF
jgi:hypothetical protein